MRQITKVTAHFQRCDAKPTLVIRIPRRLESNIGFRAGDMVMMTAPGDGSLVIAKENDEASVKSRKAAK